MDTVIRVAAVQAEPVWFDLDGGIDKTITYIEQAAARGAQLVAFGENWLPGYPWWIWLDSPAAGMQFVPRYAAAAMERNSADMRRLQDAAAAHGVHLSFGFTERDGGTLYMAQALIDDHGEIVSVRRKLKPTHVERSVFGEGDGSDLDVFGTDLGRIGQLCCWEHLQPLTKYAMADMDEEIHIAAWPSFSVYRGAATALGPEVNTAAALMYAVETQSFVISPSGMIGQAAHDLFCDTEVKKQLLALGGGFARIYGPEGTPLAEPLPETEEGILFADLDPALRAIAKSAADPTGHYSRPDVLQLRFNRTAAPPVVAADTSGTSAAGTATGASVTGADSDEPEAAGNTDSKGARSRGQAAGGGPAPAASAASGT